MQSSYLFVQLTPCLLSLCPLSLLACPLSEATQANRDNDDSLDFPLASKGVTRGRLRPLDPQSEDYARVWAHFNETLHSHVMHIVSPSTHREERRGRPGWSGRGKPPPSSTYHGLTLCVPLCMSQVGIEEVVAPDKVRDRYRSLHYDVTHTYVTQTRERIPSLSAST